MSFQEYASSMKKHVKRFVENTPSASLHIYLRSVHENPLGNRISSCPPKDWRNPEVVRLYNDILMMLCQDIEGVNWLDTRQVMSPLWDSADDWCHYSNFVGRAEAVDIISRITPLSACDLTRC